MKRLTHLKLTPLERKAINAFSRRVKRAMGKDLLTIRLFGSKVRGDFHGQSDIDIYIVVREKKPRVRNLIAEIDAAVWDEFDVSLSPVVYSAYEERKNLDMHSFFFEAVQRESILI